MILSNTENFSCNSNVLKAVSLFVYCVLKANFSVKQNKKNFFFLA